MNPEKEHKKGGSRLQKSTEKPEKQKKPRVPLTSRQKALRVVYIVVTVIAAIIVTAFAASRLLFVKPNVPTTQNRRGADLLRRAGDQRQRAERRFLHLSHHWAGHGRRREHRHGDAGGLRCAQSEAERHEHSP